MNVGIARKAKNRRIASDVFEGKFVPSQILASMFQYPEHRIEIELRTTSLKRPVTLCSREVRRAQTPRSVPNQPYLGQDCGQEVQLPLLPLPLPRTVVSRR